MSFIYNNKKETPAWSQVSGHYLDPPGLASGHRSHTENYSHITLWQQLKLRSVFIRPQSHFVKLKFLNQAPFAWGMKTRTVTPFITGKIKCSQREESPTLKWKPRWGWEMRPLTTGYSYQNQLSVIKCLLCTGDYANWFAYIILSKSQNKPIRQLVLSVPVYGWGTKV